MGSHYGKDVNGNLWHISRADIYRYRGFTFEWHDYLGPTKVRARDWEPAARTGRKFYRMLTAWLKLSPSKRKRTLIAE